MLQKPIQKNLKTFNTLTQTKTNNKTWIPNSFFKKSAKIQNLRFSTLFKSTGIGFPKSGWNAKKHKNTNQKSTTFFLGCRSPAKGFSLFGGDSPFKPKKTKCPSAQLRRQGRNRPFSLQKLFLTAASTHSFSQALENWWRLHTGEL